MIKIKDIWYWLFATIVGMYLKQFFSRITVSGNYKQYKGKGAMLLLNHPNSFIDPIISPIILGLPTSFLTRASAFKIPFIAKTLRTFKMLPIYRIRDGKEKLRQNQEIFDACAKRMVKGEVMLFFPEGSHSPKLQVRNLRTGFINMSTTYLGIAEDKSLPMVPVALHYENTISFGKELAIHVLPSDIIDQGEEVPFEDRSKKYKSILREKYLRVLPHFVHDKYEATVSYLYMNYCETVLQEPNNSCWLNTRQEAKEYGEYLLEHTDQDPKIDDYLSSIDDFISKKKKFGFANINIFQPNGFFSIIKQLFLVIITMPFFIVGSIFHLLPMIFARYYVLDKVKDPCFKGPFFFSAWFVPAIFLSIVLYVTMIFTFQAPWYLFPIFFIASIWCATFFRIGLDQLKTLKDRIKIWRNGNKIKELQQMLPIKLSLPVLH